LLLVHGVDDLCGHYTSKSIIETYVPVVPVTSAIETPRAPSGVTWRSWDVRDGDQSRRVECSLVRVVATAQAHLVRQPRCVQAVVDTHLAVDAFEVLLEGSR